MQDILLHIVHLVKRYDNITAVDNLSIDIYAGDIFGLLGPNGAGKTTTIRIIMDIFKADEGIVQVLGKAPGAANEQIGYLPEERGLYPKRKVLDTLVYLAQLKGMERAQARDRALYWLERVDLAEWAHRRIEDLSRGMQQKVQIIAACVHSPKLIVLDEPFQGLDPVNVEVIRGLMRELQKEGITLVLSAHEMNRVEELCNRIAIINHGRAVLYGDLQEIKAKYGGNTVRLRTPVELGDLPGVTRKELRNHDWVLTIGTTDPQVLLRTLIERDVPIELFEVGTAPLEEIFIDVVTREKRYE
ncbi:MAG: ABC transporter ATP-binding protein [Anaerolineae bacterium]